MKREDGEDLVAVDRVPVTVHGEHAVAVAVEGDAEVVAAGADGRLEERQIGGAAALVDVLAVRRRRHRGHLGAEALECLRSDPRVRAVRAVDGDPETGQVGAEALDDMLQVAVLGDAHAVDRTAAVRRSVEERLDLLLDEVRELVSVAVEELDAVVLRRVVRGGDHDAQVESEQGDGGRRQHAGENRVATCGNDTACERLLELRPRAAGVAADEDAAASGPECRRPSQLLDELDGQVLAEDTPDPVRAEESAQEES